VQTYERMGASAVFLEDQAWPKRCGHMAGKKVVPTEIMEAKIRATMAERLDAETLICVRTDARAVLGFDEALRRAERYINAGAEAIFVEAPESVEASNASRAASTCRNSPIRWSAGAPPFSRPRNSSSSDSTRSASVSKPLCTRPR